MPETSYCMKQRFLARKKSLVAYMAECKERRMHDSGQRNMPYSVYMS